MDGAAIDSTIYVFESRGINRLYAVDQLLLTRDLKFIFHDASLALVPFVTMTCNLYF